MKLNEQDTLKVTTRSNHHIRTPLISSDLLSEKVGRQVYLKLENLQPGGSFKIRGHGHLVATHVRNGCRHFISSSGGNAGMAVALACRAEGVHATIVVPETTPEFMVRRLRAVGAEVKIHGAVWDIADEHARALVQVNQNGRVYVSPFDNELLWEGLGPYVEEIRDDLHGVKPSAIIVSVGGGGLFLGTALGCSKLKWDDVCIVAAETTGADSFAQMLQQQSVVTLPAITSIAKSLGALAVSERCVDLVVRQGRPVQSVVVSDREAVEGCSFLATHHRMLVEPACGAALAAVTKLSSKTVNANTAKTDNGTITNGFISNEGPIVVVVCGGSMASPELLREWVKSTGGTEVNL